MRLKRTILLTPLICSYLIRVPLPWLVCFPEKT